MTDTTHAAATVLRAHLEGEVTRLHRERRNGLIFGGLAVLLVILYSLWISAQATYWSRPDNLALTAAGLVEAYIPSMKRAAVETVQREAPALAIYVGDQVSSEVPRLIREMVSAIITEYAEKLTDFAATKYVEAFATLIQETRAELQQAVAAEAPAEQELLVAKALERQFQAMGKKVEEGELQSDPLFVQIEKSHQALANLNKRLQKLISQDDRNVPRKDKLTKRFLGTFWRFVQQENPDVKVEGDGVAAPAGK